MSKIIRKFTSLPSWARWGILVLVAAGAAVIVLSVAYGVRESGRMPHRFNVVIPGKLLRSAQPSEDELENVFRKYAVHTALSLRHEDYPEYETERRVAGEYGAEFVRVPVSSTESFTPDQLAELRRLFADESAYPILVHCQHGKARTGVVVALWRIEHDGWAGARAVEEMLKKGYPVRDKSEQMREVLSNWKRGQEFPDSAKPAASE